MSSPHSVYVLLRHFLFTSFGALATKKVLAHPLSINLVIYFIYIYEMINNGYKLTLLNIYLFNNLKWQNKDYFTSFFISTALHNTVKHWKFIKSKILFLN